MKKYTADELAGILAKHDRWFRGTEGGKRADLQDADLRRADLQGADLRGADLQGADLRRADLRGADLRGVSLRGADLREADLRGADLWEADLRDTDLQGVDFRRADLRGADLQGAKNAESALARMVVPSEGDIIGWKKAWTPSGEPCIVKLRIPEAAKRSNATGRKCRAEYAEVLEVFGAEYAKSDYDGSVKYRPGQTVRPDSWDDNRWNECSHGIHFFITRTEAEEWNT